MFTIGDSNAMGYNLRGYQGNPNIRTDPEFDETQNYTNFDYLHGVYGSFPEIVAKELGIAREDHNVFAYSAVRAKDAFYFLGGDADMEGDRFFDIFKGTWMPPIVKDSGAAPGKDVGPNFINQLSTGDNKLVLMYAGASDVIFSSMTEALAGLNGLDDIAGALTDIIGIMWKNYQSFLEYVPKLIARVKELNPTCTLVVVGTFNPIKDLKISDDIYLPIADAFSLITGRMNQNYRQWAKDAGAIYVDITNVETATLEKGLSIAALSEANPELIYHATPEGYKYIARQILKELEIDRSVTTDIAVDLGSVKNVSSVLLDGYIVKDYSFDEDTHTLTVPCSSKGAKLLTVTERRAGGTYLATYQLSWSEDDGYTAYRLLASMNVFETVSSFVSPFMSFFKTVFDAFFSFFR